MARGFAETGLAPRLARRATLTYPPIRAYFSAVPWATNFSKRERMRNSLRSSRTVAANCCRTEGASAVCVSAGADLAGRMKLLRQIFLRDLDIAQRHSFMSAGRLTPARSVLVA